jgi:hypothetical protein
MLLSSSSHRLNLVSGHETGFWKIRLALMNCYVRIFVKIYVIPTMTNFVVVVVPLLSVSQELFYIVWNNTDKFILLLTLIICRHTENAIVNYE